MVKDSTVQVTGERVYYVEGTACAKAQRWDAAEARAERIRRG